MNPISPQSPEKRAERGEHAPRARGWAKFRASYAFEILKRVLVGVYSDGFIHAGNLAYLALISLFPFFIVAAAFGSLLGQDAETRQAVGSFLSTLPPSVGDLLRQPILDVLTARTGSLLWLGALVGLWTVGSFIETIRDVFRRAYGVPWGRPFWHYRLGSAALTIGSVVIVLISFLIQGLLVAVEQFIYRVLPFSTDVGGFIGWTRLIPAAIMFGALYVLFYTVTPSKYRAGNCPKWPGALLTTLWWIGATAALPRVLAMLGGYDLTYGSLAGVIVTLLFFFIIGLGVSMAAHLNAALAEGDVPAVEGASTPETVRPAVT